MLLQEDELLCELVKKYGPKRWSVIASHFKGRIGKQCRERYVIQKHIIHIVLIYVIDGIIT